MKKKKRPLRDKGTKMSKLNLCVLPESLDVLRLSPGVSLGFVCVIISEDDPRVLLFCDTNSR